MEKSNRMEHLVKDNFYMKTTQSEKLPCLAIISPTSLQSTHNIKYPLILFNKSVRSVWGIPHTKRSINRK